MQLTINSTEPLEKVLAAVGGLYDVRLVIDTGASSAAGIGDSAPRTATPRRGRQSKQAARRSAAVPAKRISGRRKGANVAANPGDIRAWAAGQGLAVSSRGRISRDVVEAYQRAHG